MPDPVPFADAAEMASAALTAEIFAFSLMRHQSNLYLKCAVRTVGTQTVYLHQSVAETVLAALEALIPASERTTQSTTVDITVGGMPARGVQEGEIEDG
jgi:hypothetical protein